MLASVKSIIAKKISRGFIYLASVFRILVIMIRCEESHIFMSGFLS